MPGPIKENAHVVNANRNILTSFLQHQNSPAPTSRNTLTGPNIIACPNPCGGLTCEQHSQISVYLMRSQAAGGGARPRKDIVHELFGEDVKWGDLNKRQQLRVERVEAIEFQWLNFREQGFVLSTRCLKTSLSGNSVGPCDECSNLLKNKVFKNALQRRLPKEENLRYTPLAYRAKLTGEQYTKMVGVYDIVQKATNVRCLLYLLVNDCLHTILPSGWNRSFYPSRFWATPGRIQRDPIRHNNSRFYH